MENSLSLESIINNYKLLESSNEETRMRANSFLLAIVGQDEAWMLAKV